MGEKSDVCKYNLCTSDLDPNLGLQHLPAVTTQSKFLTLSKVGKITDNNSHRVIVKIYHCMIHTMIFSMKLDIEQNSMKVN